MSDPGDEDDAATHPDRWIRVALAGWTYREGKLQIFYPAVRVPSEHPHDPGDEQPVMQMDPEFLRRMEAYL